LDGILEVIGIEGKATFTRSMLVNVQEEITSVIAAAQYLDETYVTSKIMTILGDADQIDEVLKRIDADQLERISEIDTEEQETPEKAAEE
jgi:hypothetical protein